ncbi:hypothetical protein AWH66_2006390 [Vibrio barjaei]|nr:hypothetical protein AWH66_2006390 [Vibrio barjaei]
MLGFNGLFIPKPWVIKLRCGWVNAFPQIEMPLSTESYTKRVHRLIAPAFDHRTNTGVNHQLKYSQRRYRPITLHSFLKSLMNMLAL